MPTEPADTPILRVPLDAIDVAEEIVAEGGTLSAGWLLAGYRSGIFPMPHVDDEGETRLFWYWPLERGQLPLNGFVASRSLRSAMRRHTIRVDTEFEQVLVACARADDPEHLWLSAAFADTYRELHALGWAHSVEAWTLNGQLAGGVLGVEIGGLFSGDTMVSFLTNGSKVALAGAIELLNSDPRDRIFDTQWLTPHLASLGGVEVSRAEYARQLERALRRDPLL